MTEEKVLLPSKAAMADLAGFLPRLAAMEGPVD